VEFPARRMPTLRWSTSGNHTQVAVRSR